MKKKRYKILFTGGGTGGHITPIIAIVRELRRVSKEEIQFYFMGPKDEIGEVLLSQEGIKIKRVMAGKIRRYFGFKSFFQNIFDILFKIPIGVFQAYIYIFFLNPNVIFCKGGFGSIPGVIAGKLLFAPVFLHESDVSPGMANRFLSNFSLENFVSFPKTEYFPLKKMILVGNPIRREVLEGSKEEAKRTFKISSDKPVVLILGGSQGAQRINDKILEIIADLLKNFEVIHQCGDKNYQEVKNGAKVMLIRHREVEGRYHLYPFLKEPELARAYAVADFVVSRAGSGTIFEIAAAEKPSILIPLPESAQDHQVKNAYAYAQNGACEVIEEVNFTSRFFLERLKYFFSDEEEMEKIKKAIKEFAKPQAAKIIANYLIEYLKS